MSYYEGGKSEVEMFGIWIVLSFMTFTPQSITTFPPLLFFLSTRFFRSNKVNVNVTNSLGYDKVRYELEMAPFYNTIAVTHSFRNRKCKSKVCTFPILSQQQRIKTKVRYFGFLLGYGYFTNRYT